MTRPIPRNISKHEVRIRKELTKRRAVAQKKREADEKRDAKKRKREEGTTKEQNAKTSTDNSPPTQNNNQSARPSEAESSSGPQTVAIAPYTELVDKIPEDDQSPPTPSNTPTHESRGNAGTSTPPQSAPSTNVSLGARSPSNLNVDATNSTGVKKDDPYRGGGFFDLSKSPLPPSSSDPSHSCDTLPTPDMIPPPVDRPVPLQEPQKKFSPVLRVPIQVLKKTVEGKFGTGNKGKECDDDCRATDNMPGTQGTPPVEVRPCLCKRLRRQSDGGIDPEVADVAYGQILPMYYSRNQLEIEERREREAKEREANEKRDAKKRRREERMRDAKKRRHEERMRDEQNAKTSTDNELFDAGTWFRFCTCALFD